MPTILNSNGFRFYFYSNENNEPMHVHIEKGGANGKIWLSPVFVAYMHGFSTAEERQILNIIENNIVTLEKSWNDYFSK